MKYCTNKLLLKLGTTNFYKKSNANFLTNTVKISVKIRNVTSSSNSQNLSVPLQNIDNARPLSEMPGPKSYPFIKSSLKFLANKELDVKKIYKLWDSMIKEYGPIMQLDMLFQPPTVLITTPEDIETVFRSTLDNPVRNAFTSLKKVRYDAVDNYFEKKGGILVENDEEWWRVRSQVQTPMMRPKNIFPYLNKMDDVTLEFMQKISKFQVNLGEMPENFQEELYRWALESVSLVALNRRLGCLDEELSENSTQLRLISIVNKVFACLNATEMDFPWWKFKFLPSPSLKKLQSYHDEFLRIVDSYIQEAEAELKEKEPDNPTLLQILLCREGLTRRDVITFLLDMFFAGIDTTSHTLGFTMFLLARNPKAQAKLHDEVDKVLGDGTEALTEKHLANLSYLKCCIKEAQRIFPITFGSVRHLHEEVTLGGYKIPKGYQVFMYNYGIMRNEKYFEKPLEYLPERWERSQPLGSIHPFAFLPFSHGKRMCIGRRIAEQEMYVFLARLMHRFKIDYKYDDMEMLTRLISVPSLPLKFNFHERK